MRQSPCCARAPRRASAIFDARAAICVAHRARRRAQIAHTAPRHLSRSLPLATPQPQGRDLSRFVKWPAYIRMQRQRKILYERLDLFLNPDSSTVSVRVKKKQRSKQKAQHRRNQ